MTLATSLKLVGPDGSEFNYTPACEPLAPPQRGRFETRVALAAAHVVVDPAYLNGFQSHFRMVGGRERARSVAHLSELFVLADQARVLRDPEFAARRMSAFLLPAGVA